MDHLQPQLPEGLTVLESQVAGHTFNPKTLVLGMLKDETCRCVFKPMGKPECGAREKSFYESLQTTTDPMLMAARKLVPKYYKTLNLNVNSREHAFMQLEDLTHGMRSPCIMDVKVGKRTWDPLASSKKRIEEEQKYVQCKQVLGVCLPGFQVFSNSGYAKFGKDYGKQIDAKGFRESLKIFFNAQTKVCQPLIREILRQLYEIRSWFREQKLFHFYASSLLLIYDYSIFEMIKNAQSDNSINDIHDPMLNGNPVDLSHICCNATKDMMADLLPPTATKDRHIYLEDYIKVKMIDFAHVFPTNNDTIDTNYMFGLESLINILEDMLLER